MGSARRSLPALMPSLDVKPLNAGTASGRRLRREAESLGGPSHSPPGRRPPHGSNRQRTESSRATGPQEGQCWGPKSTGRWPAGDRATCCSASTFPSYPLVMPRLPLSDAAKDTDADGEVMLDILSEEPRLHCAQPDVRHRQEAARRPYIEVAPLVEVSAENLAEIRSGRAPRFAARSRH